MWRVPDINDLLNSISQREIDAFNNAAASSSDANTSDPTVRQIRSAVAFVRGYIASSPKGVLLDKDQTTLPDGLIPPAMDYCAYQILKRLPGDISQSRTDARKEAIDLFKLIPLGDYIPESHSSTAASGSKSAVTVALSSRLRAKADALDRT